jgi:cathepsin X
VTWLSHTEVLPTRAHVYGPPTYPYPPSFFAQGCDGGDVIDVLRYMTKFGLPDETCLPYNATDHTKYGKHAKRCPAEGYCMNCMPIKVRGRRGVLLCGVAWVRVGWGGVGRGTFGVQSRYE